MVTIDVNGNTAIFEVQGLDKLWSFKSRLEIPVKHIQTAYQDPNCAMDWFDSVKLLGTSVPGIFRAGTFYQKGDRVFWDVHDLQNAIVVELDHEHFSKLIIEVADPVSAIIYLIMPSITAIAVHNNIIKRAVNISFNKALRRREKRHNLDSTLLLPV